MHSAQHSTNAAFPDHSTYNAVVEPGLPVIDVPAIPERTQIGNMRRYSNIRIIRVIYGNNFSHASLV